MRVVVGSKGGEAPEARGITFGAFRDAYAMEGPEGERSQALDFSLGQCRGV